MIMVKFTGTRGLTYDDVLLVPRKSRIRSRSEVDTSTSITKKIKLKLPFVSSNVDTVTESSMAIAMAELGGIGIIHRFLPIDRQVSEVEKVKRSEGFILGSPFVLTPNHTLGEARREMKKQRVTSFIVVDKQNQILGLVSERDMWFEDNHNLKITQLMTPKDKLITASTNISLEAARKLFKKHKVEKLPLVDHQGRLTGLITSRTVLNQEIFPHATKDPKGRLRVGAAVGIIGDFLERAQALVKAGVDILVVDVAHVHSAHGLSAVKTLRKNFPQIQLIAGNIATAQAALDLIRLECDAIKVGIGPGGICITRMIAGAGVPQLTAIMDCAKIAHKYKVPLIADGGTNHPADMTKALAAGASSVMLTGWLAGTDESPGSLIMRRGQKYKIHRGAASFSAMAERKLNGVSGQIRKELSEIADLDEDLGAIVAEGVESLVPYKGAVKDVIQQLHGALRSGMSYANATTIRQLWRQALFMEISPASFSESKAHNVQEI